MAKKKFNITVYHNGESCGFISSINYNENRANVTNNQTYARVYRTEDEVQSEIDYLTKHYFEKGYVFGYI